MTDNKEQKISIKRALISVFDKVGLDELATGLHEAGVEIVSTGSTAKVIRETGVPVTDVSEITGFPECLDGRVKTLHPVVHAGILADTHVPAHMQQLEELGIEGFQLVIVNLYPFEQTVASGAGYADCVEKIDIGGPSMVRGAAKNHGSVAVVVDSADYAKAAEAAKNGGFTYEERQKLALKAFTHTAEYDVHVSQWFADQLGSSETRTLRYGENPHQKATVHVTGEGLAAAEQFGGKEMSFNNYRDADAAWAAAWDHADPCVAIIKHTNPCGIAVSHTSIADAHKKAHACDPKSAYGGVIAVNREVSLEMAQQVRPIFTEVIIAPSYEPVALELLQEKKNLRILQCDEPHRGGMQTMFISGGVLEQERDVLQAEGDDPKNWKLVAGEPATAEVLADLEFAWRSIRCVKSNAILIANHGATVGVGMGQVNRVDSAKLAVERANTLADDTNRTAGAVAASDAFFPFADGFEILAKAGVQAVVQPGGSIRDEEVIEAAKKAGITMYLTGTRHFLH